MVGSAQHDLSATRRRHAGVQPPVSLLVELTHRCPLHCVYCSNPLLMNRQEEELSTEAWLGIIDQAAALGVLQLHFSGGEPLLRRDLLELVTRASGHELFTNLITSGIGLTDTTLDRLAELNLGSFQLSLQAADEAMTHYVAGGPFLKKKLEIGRKVRSAGLSLSINAVLHRMNLHQVGELIDLAASLGADRIELANTQYYGWALLNRDYLLPSRAQVDAATRVVQEKRREHGERMEIIWVVPDYHDDFPKPCMGGWGEALFSIAPDGTVMPCLAAQVIPDLDLPSALEHDLDWIWYESRAFNAYRGVEWMQEPCRSCPMRFTDHGGCRCQAMLLTGHAAATDPVCIYSPRRNLVEEAKERADRAERVDGAGRADGAPRADVASRTGGAERADGAPRYRRLGETPGA